MGIPKIEKDLYNRIVRTVNAQLGNYITFNRNCSFETIDQSFFPSSTLLSIVDYDCIPASKLMVVDNGMQSYPLSGSEQWANLLDVERLNLNIRNVLDYLKLYYSTYIFPYQDQKIVETPEDLEFTEFPKLELFEAINQQIQAPVITSTNNQFTIYCNITANQSLYNAAFDIYSDGKVILLDKKIVLRDLPIGEMVIDL
ncbi:MAG: hypothetical protein AB1777_08360 [Bacteroidota bacterium]